MLDYLTHDTPALLIGASILALALIGWAWLNTLRNKRNVVPPQTSVVLLVSAGVAVAIAANLDARALLILGLGALAALAILLAKATPQARRRGD
jgi:hypothetical protein